MMDASKISVTHVGVDYNGLEQEQPSGFLALDHHQSLSQGSSLVQFADFIDVTKSFGQIASPKATSLLDLQRLVELSVLPFVQSKFQELYERTDWAEILKISFGDDVDLAKGRELLGQLAVGKGILQVEVVETEELKARGAFGDSRIFLGDQLVRQGDVNATAQVIVEEIGHSLDRKINIIDAVGDEGEIFANLVFDQPLDAMNLATLKAENDSAVRKIDGQSLAVELSAFVVKGSILSFYQSQGAQGGALGVPLTEEVATSYGWRQDFQGGTVIHSPQYGSQLVKGSVGNYYRGLSEAQRNQLGAPYTPENSLGGGNWRQFFQGGTVEWKNNGTGEVKSTPYSIGSNGSNINVAFTNKFNEVDGWVSLGNSAGNVRAIAGGTVQDFERGSIYHSATGTFVLRGTISSYHRTNAAALGLGLPVSDEIFSSYRRQDFQGGIVIYSLDYGFQILKGNLASFYKGLSDDQRSSLGAPGTLENYLTNGGQRQFFMGGTLEWKINGTGEVKLTSYPIGQDGRAINLGFTTKFNEVNGWDTLGNPISVVKTITGGKVQDFERGSIFQSAAGTFSLQGTLNSFYKNLSAADKLRLGLPIGSETSAGGYWHQSFQNGELQLVQGVPVKWSSQILISDRYSILDGVNKLGAAVGLIRDVNGVPVQDYQKGSIFVNGNSAVAVSGLTLTYYRANSALLGLPVGEEAITSYGNRQEFQNATVMFSPQFGIQIVRGSVGGYFRSLSVAQQNLLGAAFTAEAVGGDGNWQQFFKGGTVLWKSNGTGEVKFTSYPIGGDGNTVNPLFAAKFNAVVGWDALGSPTGNVRSVTGGTVQDFEKGMIMQTNAGIFALDAYVSWWYRQDPNALGLPTSDKVSIIGGFKQEFEKGIVFGTPTNQTFILKDSFAAYYRGLSTTQVQELGALTSNFVYISNGTAQYFQNGAILNSPQFGLKLVNGSIGNYYAKSLAESTRYWLGVPYTNSIDLGGGNSRQFFTGGTIEWKANDTGEVRFIGYPIGSTSTTINTAFISKFNESDGWNTLGNPSSYVRSIIGGSIQDFSNGSIIQTGAGVFVLETYINSTYKQEQIALGLPTSNKVSTASGFRQDFEKGIIFINPNNQTFVLKDSFANYYRGLTAAQSQELGVLTNNIASVNNGTTQVFQNGAIVNSAQNGFQLLNGSLGSYYSKGLSDSSRYWLGTPYTASLSLSGGNLRQFFTGGAIDWKANGTGELRFTSYPIGSTGTSTNNAFISKFNEIDGWNSLGYPSSNVRSITGGNIQDFSNGSIIQTGAGVFVVDSYINSTYKQEQAALGLPTGNKIPTASGFRQEFEKGIIFINPSNQTFVLKDSFASYYRGLTAAQSQELGVLTSNIASVNGGTTQIFQNGAVVNSVQNGFQLLNGSLGSYYSKGLSDSSRYWLGTSYTASLNLSGGNLRQFFTGGTIDWKANGTGELRFTSFPIGSTGTSINNAFISKFNEIDGWNSLGYPSSNVRSITGGNIQDFSNGSIIQTGVGVFVVDSYINSTYKQEQAALGLPTGNKIPTASGFRQEFEKGIIFINPSNQTFVLKDSFASYYRGLTAAQSQELGVLTSNIASVNGGTTQIFQNGAVVNSVQNGFQLLNGSLGSYYSKGLSDSSRYWLGTPYTASLSLSGGNLRQFFTGGAIDWKANGTGELRFTSYPIGSTGTSTNNAFISKFNEIDGWNSLGYPSSNVRSITGGSIQDFSYGTIIQTNAGVFTLDAATTGWYRQDPSALGLPISHKVSITGGFKQEFEKGIIFTNSSNQTFILKDSFASFYRGLSSAQIQELGALTSNFTYVNNGTAQYFQNGALLNSTQFGLKLVNGSIGNYYVTGLAESTRSSLGVPYTGVISLAGGGLRQFFTGGTIEWKANGTGEVRFSSYPIGSTGSSINADFIAKFNEVDGWITLGNPTSTVSALTGGSIQLFSNGSIVQTNSGVYVLDAATTSLYRQEQSALGLPTGNRMVTGSGFKQDFEKGIIFSTSNQVFVLKDTFASYYRGLSTAQMQELGALTSNFSYVNGGTAQYFQTGAIYQTQAGTFSVRGTEFNQLYTQNVGSLGLSISDVVSTTYGTRQDFQNGSIFKSSAGTFVVDGLISGMYRYKFSSFGAPIGNKVSIANGFRQDFQNGTLISNVATSQTFALTDSIATYYKGLSSTQLQELGALVANARESNGTLVQDFQSGSIYKTAKGTFRTSGEIGKYDFERSLPGLPLSEAVTTSYGSRQDFSEGTIMYSSKTGLHIIEGSLGKYYQSLTEDQKTRLGFTYNHQRYYEANSSFRFFQGGVLVANSNGSNQIRLNSSVVGFDGNNFNDDFINKFISLDEFSGFGDPTSNIYNINGILRQDFQKGYITQNGSTIESLLWPANLGVLGLNKLNANGRATASLPIAYTFTVNQQTYSSITLFSNNLGVPGLTLLNSQNQVVAGDAQSRSVQSNLAPGTYTVKVTSTSVSDFTLDVQVSTAPPPVFGGGVIIINGNNNTSQSNNSGNNFPIKGSVGDYYYNKISADQRQHLGQPTEAEVFLGNGLEWRQNFQNGTIFHGAKGSYIVQNSLRNTYNNELSEGDRQRLGMPIGNEILSDHWYQVFEHGELQLVSNSPVRWTDGGNAQVNQTAGVRVGFDGTSAHNTYINTFNRSGGGAGIGTAISNVHAWANGYAQDFQGGNEGRGAILKSNANDNSYWVGGGFWDAYLATGHGADGALGYPTFDRVGNRQNFQNGALISGSNGIFAVYGGIGGHYLNNEGGENGRLGAPTSKEEGLGGNKIVQHFQYGDILYGSGATSTLMTSGATVRYLSASEEFTGTVMPSVGVAYRYTPHENDRSGISHAYNTALVIDALITGDTLIDTKIGKPDSTWYHVKGENYWVPSAYVDGGVGRSIFPSSPLPSNPTPTTSTVTTPFGSNAKLNDFLARFIGASNISRLDRGDLQGECVSLIARYLEEEYLSPSERSRALTLGNGGETARRVAEQFSDFFKPVSDPSPPVRGSIISFPSLSQPYGHVAIVTDVEIIDNQSFRVKVVDSNSLDGRIVVNHNYWITIDKYGNGSSGYGDRIEWVNPKDAISNSYISAPVNPVILPRTGGSSNVFSMINDKNYTILSPANNTNNWANLTKYKHSVNYEKDKNGVNKPVSNDSVESVNIGLYNISMGQSANSISNKKTWVIVHGFNDSPENGKFTSLANSIEQHEPGDQILVLNWSQAAKQSLAGYNYAVEWVDDVAHLAANKLSDYGINPGNISIIGHSLGGIVANRISEYIDQQGKGQIDRLVALDPAAFTGIYHSANVNFALHSKYSWAFWGSHLSDESIAKNADESFHIDFPFNLYPVNDKNHGTVVQVFINLLDSKSFNLQKITDSKIRPWVLSAGYEAYIGADDSGSITSVQYML